MEDGFIGMNPVLAKQNIEDFRTKMGMVELEYTVSVNALFNDLSNAWSSKKAVEFYERYNVEANDLSAFITNFTDSISQAAVNAYNAMASTIGERLISEQYYDANSTLTSEMYHEVLVDNKAGKSGMNVQLVKNFILPAFEKNVQKIYSALDEVPTSIALYDDENAQASAYSTNIANLKGKISDLVGNMKSEVVSAIENEADNMLLAKQQSTNAMNG